jgi:hypothetical protein
VIFAAITLVRPTFQVVVAADAFDIRVQLVSTGEDAGLIGTHAVRLSAARDFAFSVTNHDHRSVASIVYIDPVNARTRRGKSQIRRVNLENFIATQAPDANSQRAFGELQLSCIVVQIQKRKTGVGA